jgi:acyl carrier protein
MLDRESIRQSLLAFLEEDLGEPIPCLDDEVVIREGLGLDSVDVVGLVMQVERRYRIRLASEELTEIVQVGQMLDLLEVKIRERAEADAAAELASKSEPDAREAA